MRVIAGSVKGRKLISPDSDAIRPTADRAKENLFNILSDINGTKFLDLFSGTGAIGIEALSRGASRAVFADVLSADLIKKNLKLTRFENLAKVISADYITALRRLKNEQFDIIFMDPPYNCGLVPLAAKIILEYDLLKQSGLMVAEVSSKEYICIPGFKLYNTRKYGAAAFLFLERE
ncbi:MAG: 16S rRNA (guanine(966)-N(2))-methyltransferase RsmD [Clostridiales bacterium]|jgi:16S rRNA (guanine(966)-N(2))-methyltransferase RsmD|nr:16S rRNA (guanine(966)-N(2))-methyltransferase RsmD [Clostridiales bacterium]